jgi:hypothetical protein
MNRRKQQRNQYFMKSSIDINKQTQLHFEVGFVYKSTKFNYCNENVIGTWN